MLNENLKDIRTYFDLTQKEISEILNVSRSTYAGWENSIDNIPLTKLNSFSNYFDISLDYLCGLTSIKKYNIINKEIDINVAAKNLKRIRLQHNDTQDKIAKVINTDRSNYSRYELGKNLILTSLIIDFAKYYKVSIDWLLGKTKNNMLENKK